MDVSGREYHHVPPLPHAFDVGTSISQFGGGVGLYGWALSNSHTASLAAYSVLTLSRYASGRALAKSGAFSSSLHSFIKWEAAIRVHVGAVCIDTTKSTACVITLWFLEVVCWKRAPTSIVGAAFADGEWYCDVESWTDERSNMSALEIATGKADFMLISAVTKEYQPDRKQ